MRCRLPPPVAVLRLALICLAALPTGPVQAANWAWASTPASANWAGTNWTSGAVPGSATGTPAPGDQLYFGSSSQINLTNDDLGFAFGGLTFLSGGSAFTLAGNGFTLNGGLTNNSAASLVINNALGGPAGLIQSGTGNLQLAGPNTFSGGLTVNSGSLTLLGNQSGAPGGWLIGTNNGASASMTVGSASQSAPTLASLVASQLVQVGGTGGNVGYETLTVAGASGQPTLVTNNGSLWCGRNSATTLGANATWLQNGPLTIAGVGGYGAGLNVAAGGTLLYNNPNALQLIPGNNANGAGTLLVNGGTVVTLAGFNYQTGAGASGQVILQNGGSLVLGASLPALASGAASGHFWLGTNAVINPAGFSTTLGFPLANASGQTGSLILTGGGTLTLTGTNTFTGPTTLAGGTLALTGGGSLATSAALTVLAGSLLDVSGVAGGWQLASGQTLSGNGAVSGPVTLAAGATLQPGLGGSDTGSLQLNSPLALGGTTWIAINRTNSPNAAKLTGITALSAGGTLVVTNTGSALQAGDLFVLFNAASCSGTFANVILPPLNPNQVWNTNNLYLHGWLAVQSGTNYSALNLNPSTSYQTITGIGGNLAGGEQLALYNASTNLLNNAFSPAGLNLSFLRIDNPYGQTEPAFDGLLKANNTVIAAFRALQPHGKIMMTAWSPPGALKSTGSAFKGTLAKDAQGKFDYANFANWWVASLKYWQSNSSLPDYVSIQNEPDWFPTSGTNNAWQAGCELTATEGTYAGYPQAFAAVTNAFLAGGFSSVRLIGPDTSGTSGNIIPTYLNQLPAGAISVAHHPYGNNISTTGAGLLTTLNAQYPWASHLKFLDEYDGDKWATNYPAWLGLAVTLHNVFALEHANAYLVWSIFYGLVYNPNGQPASDNYYAVGHYSKFINPGDWQVGVSVADTNVLAELYRHHAGPGATDRLTLILINTGPYYSYPVINTATNWAGDPAQRSWKVWQTANVGTQQWRLQLLVNTNGPSLTTNVSLTLPPYSLTTAVINSGIASNPTNLAWSVSSNSLNLAWPEDHVGWILQSQTNALAAGLGSPWGDVTNSQFGNQAVIPLNPKNPAVYFRLRHP